MPYPDEPLKKFIDDLASRTPTPGGGSTSALVGALGLGLASMAALYTTENDKFKAVEDQIRRLDASFSTLRAGFVAGIEADIQAYHAYSQARKLPRNTPEEKSARSGKIAECNEAATKIPEKIVADAQAALRLVEELSKVVNPNLAGDVAAAAYCLEASARGAGIQVVSNCAVDDKEGANSARRERMTAALAEVQAARERIEAAVKQMLAPVAGK
jgi:formiminotetrahydrofolate cyclodeaminase